MRFLRSLTIRTKLILTFVGAVGFAILITAIAFAVTIFAIIPQVLDGDLSLLTRSIQVSSLVEEQAAKLGQMVTDGALLDELEEVALSVDLGPGERARLVNTEGIILADSMTRVGHQLTAEEVLLWLPFSASGQSRLSAVTQGIIVDHAIWGYYVIDFGEAIAFTSSAKESSLERLIPMVLLSGPVLAFIVSLLLFWFFGQHLVAPIRILSRMVTNLTAGDLSVRVGLANRQDEIGKLAEDIDLMADKLQQARKEADAADQAHRYLVAAASHDLRTPLTAILAHTEALQDGISDDPKQALAVIREKGQILSSLIDDLFELASLEASEGKWETKRINLAELVRRTVIGILPELERHGMEADVEIPQEAMWVNAAPGKLERVFDNIISNGLKYGAAGKWIGVRVYTKGKCFRIEVIDRGPGILAEDREKIFEKFYRTDKSREGSVRGGGLGLAIAKEIVIRHGGRIGVDSPIPGGTKFWVEIPVKE